MNHRSDRVSRLIQEELGKLVQKELEFQDALVTITGVSVDKKLISAKVKVGVVPAGKSERALKHLHGKQGFLQHLLNNKLNIRPMPRIEFEIDHGAENAASVEKLLIEHDDSLA